MSNKIPHYFAPGDFVNNPDCPDWGIGRIQSSQGSRLTVSFENCGKMSINLNSVNLVKIDREKRKYEL